MMLADYLQFDFALIFSRGLTNLVETESRPVLIFFLAFGCVLAFDLWMGNRQRQEGNGSWKRLLGVSVLCAFMQSLPLLTGIILLQSDVVMPLPGEFNAVIAVSTIIVGFRASLYLLPPIRLQGSTETLQRYEAPDVLARIELMCRKLGIPIPVVRLLNSSGGAMAIQAFAGGLPSPSLVISDGVRHRLSQDEADAIIGHELGHIANFSLWCYPLTVCLSWSLAVVCAIWNGFWIAILFGFAVQTGLGRIVSRYFEFDSDRKAALVAGYRSIIHALDKIHISSAVSNKGWLSFLAYSVATHPSHEERLQALYQMAPTEDRPQINWSTKTALRRTIGASFACALWFALIVGSLWIPQTAFGDFLRALIYIGVSLTPQFLIQKAIRKDVRSDLKRRQFRGKSKGSIPAFLIMVIVMLILFYALDQAEDATLQNASGEIIWIIFGIPIVLGIILIGWGIWRGAKSPQTRIRLAIHQRRWQDAVQIGEEFSEKIMNDAPLRHDIILAIWMCGHREESIQAMQQLRSEFPDFKHPWLIESLMHLEKGDVSLALNLINEVRKDLQGDVSIHGIAARCYRQIGQLENVEAEAREIEKIMPDAAAVSAFRCAIAIDKKQFDVARDQWTLADSLAPGDAYITLLKAELEYQSGNNTTANETLEAARKLIHATPFAFLGAELRQVELLSNNETGIATGDDDLSLES